jgi:hypothetical protein
MERSWEKPEMIVLVSRKTDEVILATCKGSGAPAANTAVNICAGRITDSSGTTCVDVCH